MPSRESSFWYVAEPVSAFRSVWIVLSLSLTALKDSFVLSRRAVVFDNPLSNWSSISLICLEVAGTPFSSPSTWPVNVENVSSVCPSSGRIFWSNVERKVCRLLILSFVREVSCSCVAVVVSIASLIPLFPVWRLLINSWFDWFWVCRAEICALIWSPIVPGNLLASSCIFLRISAFSSLTEFA